MSENPAAPQPISIILVDDHPILTDALRLMLSSVADLRVVAVADTCAAALDLLAHTCPDVLLLDVGLPDGDGLSLAPEINRLCPATSILALTSLSDEKTLMRAIEMGVNGFISKNQAMSDLIHAIRQAADGEIVMPTSLLLGLLGRTPRAHAESAPGAGRESLSPREREVLTLLAQGKSGPQIAAALSIAPMTVRTHVRNLMDKLGVHSRLAAVSYALRHGLIEPPI